MTQGEAEEGEAGITIALSRSEALVLDRLLERWNDSGAPFSLRLDHDAEWHVLAGVRQLLLRSLLLVYSQDDYAGQLAAARENVVALWGPLDEYRDSTRDSPGTP